ncbi:lipoprotein [Sporosarcina sp. FA9]|uniref:lipoprotein n=1 Tax=Sporosarcina sp. FA9 TaxID=3413030 RepID=UPI003F65FC59
MKRLFLFLLLLLFLTGCSVINDGYSFTEMSSLDDLDDAVQEFFKRKEINEDKNGKGIFTYKVSKDTFYLYLSPKYIANNGKTFSIDVKTEKDSFDIYITDFSPKEVDEIREHRVYRVNVEKEYLRIIEVHIQVIGS